MKRFLLLTVLIQIYSAQVFSYDFEKVESIVSSGISNNYYPGAQILIGNENGVLFEKSFGNFTYDENSRVVTEESIFDIASLTKVVATTSAVMLLYQEKKIDLNDAVVKYIPEFSNNGKEDITILNLLLHNSGLKAFIPFYKYCSSKEDVLNTIYNAVPDFPANSKFVYSDLNAILLGIVVENASGMPLDSFCAVNIFDKLNMKSTMFNPDEKATENILPTENDTYWRNRLLKGEVHDEAASMLGGVAGNAGLFSNASDLYKLMKVYLNGGKYYNPFTRGLTEEVLFRTETAELFTTRYTELSYRNSRALGWDTKPDVSKSKYRMPCGELISDNCFGHTGYTGTSIWCDKDRKIVIIFLTNRVYPSRDNEGIRDIRPEIHNAVFEIISSQD